MMTNDHPAIMFVNFFHEKYLLGELQNGSAHEVGASYSGLYEEGEVEHINCGIGLNYLALTAFW